MFESSFLTNLIGDTNVTNGDTLSRTEGVLAPAANPRNARCARCLL